MLFRFISPFENWIEFSFTRRLWLIASMCKRDDCFARYESTLYLYVINNSICKDYLYSFVCCAYVINNNNMQQRHQRALYNEREREERVKPISLIYVYTIYIYAHDILLSFLWLNIKISGTRSTGDCLIKPFLSFLQFSVLILLSCCLFWSGKKFITHTRLLSVNWWIIVINVIGMIRAFDKHRSNDAIHQHFHYYRHRVPQFQYISDIRHISFVAKISNYHHAIDDNNYYW